MLFNLKLTNNLVITYNNFDFQKNIKYQLIDNHKAIRLVITKKFIHNTNIFFKELK